MQDHRAAGALPEGEEPDAGPGALTRDLDRRAILGLVRHDAEPDQTLENADAARRFEPLKLAEMNELRDAFLAAGPTMCPNCDGRCALAAGTKAKPRRPRRFYTYHEDHGIRGPRAMLRRACRPRRDWASADLVAARDACHNKLDFAEHLPRSRPPSGLTLIATGGSAHPTGPFLLGWALPTILISLPYRWLRLTGGARPRGALQKSRSSRLFFSLQVVPFAERDGVPTRSSSVGPIVSWGVLGLRSPRIPVRR